MNRMRRIRRARRSGFTLLEVLLVVGIIALLAAFVVPSFLNTDAKARRQTTEAMVKSGGTLATQIELFRMHMGTFPEELSELSTKPDGDDTDKWGGPYITDANALKDAWGHELMYKYPGEYNEGSYDLWSVGEDGDDGSDDDIKNWSSE